MFEKAFASIDTDISRAWDEGADPSLLCAITLLKNIAIAQVSNIAYVEGKPFFSTLTRQCYATYEDAAKAGLRARHHVFRVQPDGSADLC
jgi:hypothetical protein